MLSRPHQHGQQQQHQHHQPRSTIPMKRPRQDPVSCSFCRSKKLKCDRLQPCSNCSARGLSCAGQPQSHARHARDLSVVAEDCSVLARLKRLEEAVWGHSGASIAAAAAAAGGAVTAPAAATATKMDGLVDLQSKTRGRGMSFSSSTPIPCLSPPSEYEEAIHNLEEMGSRCTPHANVLEFRISATPRSPISYGSCPAAKPSPERASVPPQLQGKCFFLPPKEEGILLLDHYATHIKNLQQIVYMPAVRAMMEGIYSSIERGVSTVHSQLALLLSLFASSATLWDPKIDGDKQPLFVDADPVQASSIWTHAAMEALEFSCSITSGTLEDCQTSIILGFMLYHMEGFRTRTRALFAQAVSIARDIALHRTDMPTSKMTASSERQDPIEQEIKRRVWWYLASTDWLLALNGGPQEGTYFIQPRHMRVNYPRNVDDEDLIQNDPPVDLPITQPTTMSYYLQRVKLAEICRNVVDVIPLSHVELSTVDYEQIIELDNQFEAFFNDLPPYMRTDDANSSQSTFSLDQHSHLKVQRCGLAMMAHVRRCKLHQPYLIRRSIESHYTYSRNISLNSARAVIRLKKIVDQERGIDLSSTVKFSWVIHHVFMATIVLVMDLCFNKADDNDDARKAEVREACRILEKSGSQSDMASEFLNSLMDVLRKHKVPMHGMSDNVGKPEHRADLSAGAPVQHGATERFHPTLQQCSDPWPLQGNFQHSLSDFEEVWRDFVEFGPKLDMPEWDSLFSDLDARQ